MVLLQLVTQAVVLMVVTQAVVLLQLATRAAVAWVMVAWARTQWVAWIRTQQVVALTPIHLRLMEHLLVVALVVRVGQVLLLQVADRVIQILMQISWPVLTPRKWVS